ncbi:MAG: nuclear transport factor 2 family protein [Rhizomicrobium sp.]
MTSANDTNLLADRFMRAIETGDIETVRACYAPDARVWHNNDGLEQTLEENLKVLDWVARHLPNRRYEIKSRHVFDGGYVQQHVLHGTLRSGKPFSMPACLVVTVTNGKITRLSEYLDSAHTLPLREA